VVNFGEAPAENATLTIDFAALTGMTLTFPAGCTVAASSAVCPLGTIDPTESESVAIKATAGDTPGSAGAATLTAASDLPDANIESNLAEVYGFVSDPTYDATVSLLPPNDESSPAGPGDELPIQMAVTNNGSQAMPSLQVIVRAPSGSSLSPIYDDCEYEDYFNFDSAVGGEYGPSQATCEAPIELLPGETLALFDPTTETSVFSMVFGTNVEGPGSFYSYVAADAIPVASAAAMNAAKRSGTFAAAVMAVQRSTETHWPRVTTALQDADTSDNSADVEVFTAANPTDLAVEAAPAAGRVGETTTIHFVITNNGPADGGGPNLLITAPTGTVILRGTSPGSCYGFVGGAFDPDWTESTEVLCSFESYFPVTKPVGPGDAAKGWFKLKITATPGTDGTIETYNVGSSADRNERNNIAAIVITEPDDLANTGNRAGLIAGAGTALLVLGVGLWLLGRRRIRAA
jgi:hypothetical protein